MPLSEAGIFHRFPVLVTMFLLVIGLYNGVGSWSAESQGAEQGIGEETGDLSISSSVPAPDVK
jgi:hypothetical protein